MKTPKPQKFTFKKEPHRTGLAGTGYPYQNVAIKLGGKYVGCVRAPDWQSRSWKINIMVQGCSEGNPNATWHWIFISKSFNDEQEARKWILDNAEKLLAMNLRQQEEDNYE